VSVIFTPYNTAHSNGWHRRLAPNPDAVLLNMPRATVKQLVENGVPPGSRIGVMCTEGTKAQGLYDKALAGKYEPVYPSEDEQKAVTDGIYKGVKQNNVQEGTRLMKPVLESLLARSCHTVLLACTEIPMALDETTVGKEAAARTLNPVEAAAKRALYHVAGMKAARNRDETTYDAGSDGDLSASDTEAEAAPAGAVDPQAVRRTYERTSSQRAAGAQGRPPAAALPGPARQAPARMPLAVQEPVLIPTAKMADP